MSLLEIFDPKARPRPIGIDLGTTNSLVARVRDGKPYVIADCDQERLVPSAVYYDDRGGVIPPDLDPLIDRISREGATPLVVADGPEVLGVIELKDVVKQGIREKFDEMRQIGRMIVDAIRDREDAGVHERIRGEVRDLTARFPVPGLPQNRA